MLTAKQLHVTLFKNGIERMHIALPPRAAQRLTQLMPPQITDEALSSGIDLAGLEDSAKEDLSPRTLLDYTGVDGKHVEIWLE